MISKLKERFIEATTRPRVDVLDGPMEYFGVSHLQRAAKIYNCWKHGDRLRARRKRYRDEYEAILNEHGPLTRPLLELSDGWVIDDSRRLPHLDSVLEASDKVIAERGGQPREKSIRGFFKDLFEKPDRTATPSPYLEFVLSSDVLNTVCRYMKSIPVLSDTIPPGIRFIESTDKGQMEGPYRASQFYHRDIHDIPSVYVILLIDDVTVNSGSFTFLGASTSDRVARKVRYGRRHVPYRIPDEQMHGMIDREREENVFIYPRGTVLIIDSQKCFHFGSRDCAKPRYQIMYSFVSPCRTDFTDRDFKPIKWPVKEGDSRLRRMVLDRTYSGT